MTIDSIPLSALGLGIGLNDYEELARSVRDVAPLKKEERQKFLDFANMFFSKRTRISMQNLVFDMGDDPQFSKMASMDYARGPPEGEGIFIGGLAYHLLKNCLNAR